MLSKKQTLQVTAVSCLFVAMCAYFSHGQNYYLQLAPVIAAIALAAFMSMDKLLLVTVFFVPVSVKLSKIIIQPPFDLDLPTEPILFGITAVFLLKYLYERRYDVRILKHPVSLSIGFMIMWSIFTSVTSTMPGVSFKYSISKLWFLIPFYFVAAEMFKDRAVIGKYFTAYLLSMIVVIIYTLIRHAGFSFDHATSYWVMEPFFADHTSYGAVLALLICIITGVIIALKNQSDTKWLYAVGIIILFAGLIFSYTRAAWLGIAGAFALWVVMTFKIKMKLILIPLFIAAGLIAMNKDQIIILMSQNTTDSSTDISKHIESMTNIKSDDSNLERLNRWSCAWRMFLEKPIVGYGPGTYMFQYVPFQLSYERSRISTNASDLGNAHSEYFGPLAEQGLPGLLAFVSVIIFTISSAVRVYYRSQERWARQLSLFMLLGLLTYYIHGFLNDFLDMDKATALFWPATAMIVILDIYHTGKKNDSTSVGIE